VRKLYAIDEEKESAIVKGLAGPVAEVSGGTLESTKIYAANQNRRAGR